MVKFKWCPVQAMISAADFILAGQCLAKRLAASHPGADQWLWEPLPPSVFRHHAKVPIFQ